MAGRISDMELSKLSDRQLELLPMSALPMNTPSWVHFQLERFLANLASQELLLNVGFYWGDEWFVPDGSNQISIPFFLSHPRLAEYEESRMGERAEGLKPWDFSSLLRHEAGHVFEHAFSVSKLDEWRRLFGDRSLPYDTDNYRTNSTSRDFVINLPGLYAQSHPDEDFAETFAAVSLVGMPWRDSYAAWPGAFEKCAYVKTLILALGGTSPEYEFENGRMCEARRMRRTLGSFYEARLASRDKAAGRARR